MLRFEDGDTANCRAFRHDRAIVFYSLSDSFFDDFAGNWWIPGDAHGWPQLGRGSDCRDAVARRTVGAGAECGGDAWSLRGVVHRVRSDVPAREFGGSGSPLNLGSDPGKLLTGKE